MDKRSVLIIDLAKYYGGADVRVIDLARALDGKRPYAVATLADSPVKNRLEMESLNVIPLPYQRGNPRNILFLRQVINKRNFQVVDAHNPQSQFWGVFASKLSQSILKVATMHSAYRLEHDGSLKGRMYEQIIHLNSRLGTQFIAVSEAVNHYLLDAGIPAEKIHLIHNSVHIPDTISRSKDNPYIKSLGWDDSHFILIAVGRLEAVKGHRYLIEAVGELKDRFPHLRCLIVGSGRNEADLQSQIQIKKLNGIVHLAGFRTDINELLKTADAFIMPSLSEGLPYALLEASSHGLPVIASRVGGMAELLSDGENALLVESENVSQLRDAIAKVIDEPELRQRLSEEAFHWVESRFSANAMIEQTLAIYDQ